MVFHQPRLFVLLGLCAVVTICGAMPHKESSVTLTSNEGVSRYTPNNTQAHPRNLGSGDDNAAKEYRTAGKQDIKFLDTRGHDRGRDWNDHDKHHDHTDHDQHAHEHTHKHIHEHAHGHSHTHDHHYHH